MPTYRTLGLVVIAVVFASVAITGGVSAAEHEPDEAFFDVEITGTNGPVTEGGILVVNATVTNTGDVEDSQQIHLKDPDLEIVDSVSHPSLTLAPNETANVTLRWQTGQGDAGNATFSVQSNDDYPRGTATVEAGAFFEVAIVETNAPIVAGETLNVTVDTTNTGGAPGMTRTWIAVDGSVLDMNLFYLQPGQTGRTHLTWDTVESDAGVRILVAETDGDRVEKPITIERVDGSTSEDASADGSDGAGGATGSETTTAETATPTEQPETATPESAHTGPDSTTTSADSERSIGAVDLGNLGGFLMVLAVVSVGLLAARRLY